MKTLSVSDFKTNFSKALKDVENGEEVILTYGKNHTKIAILKPYKPKKQSLIGALKDKGPFTFSDDFEMTDEELISL